MDIEGESSARLAFQESTQTSACLYLGRLQCVVFSVQKGEVRADVWPLRRQRTMCTSLAAHARYLCVINFVLPRLVGGFNRRLEQLFINCGSSAHALDWNI